MRNFIHFTFFQIIVIIFITTFIAGCSETKSSTSSVTATTTPTVLPYSGSVTEITQTLGSDGYYTGSFTVPSNGLSFLASIFKNDNSAVGFYTFTDPNGVDLMSSSSSPTLNGFVYSGYGYANILVPQSPSFSVDSGTWSFKAYGNDSVKISLRTGSAPTSTTIVIQPYITGTTWNAADIAPALVIMKAIYAQNGITLTVNDTITITDSQYASVSSSFTNSITGALVSQGLTGAVNLFFIEDYTSSSSGVLGNAAGIPGSMGIANAWNGVLNCLTTHATGSTLNDQLLGETAAHEMGHQLGLFHTTESGGTSFDILSDTAECAKSTYDNNSNGYMSAEECEGNGAENVMFWSAWSTASQAAGKKQETFSAHQQHVFKYSPLAN